MGLDLVLEFPTGMVGADGDLGHTGILRRHSASGFRHRAFGIPNRQRRNPNHGFSRMNTDQREYSTLET
jgi:hypothetical protein